MYPGRSIKIWLCSNLVLYRAHFKRTLCRCKCCVILVFKHPMLSSLSPHIMEQYRRHQPYMSTNLKRAKALITKRQYWRIRNFFYLLGKMNFWVLLFGQYGKACSQLRDVLEKQHRLGAWFAWLFCWALSYWALLSLICILCNIWAIIQCRVAVSSK